MNKGKRTLLPIFFLLVIMIGFLGTTVTQGEQIAWSLINNNDNKDDNTIDKTLRSYISAFDSGFSEGVFLKSQYIDLFGLMQNAMNKDVIPSVGYTGTIVRGSDNKLYSANSITLENNEKDLVGDINEYSESLIRFNESLKSLGAELLYIQAPHKYHEGITLPVPIDAQQLTVRTDTFLSQIEGKINSIDLTKKIYEDNRDCDSAFFATDHHWTVDSAFWCYQEICKYLNQNKVYSVNKEYYDADNWNRIILKNSYLGSTGVRVGSYYIGKDDFSLYLPKFDTSFERHYMSNAMVDYEGDFAHCVLTNYDDLINGDYSKLMWSIYTGSDSPYVSIKNKNSDSNKRILLVKDSFGLPVGAFMSTICKELVLYDLRYEHDSSLEQYVKKERFDLVVFVYNPESLSSTMFKFEE